MVESFDCGVCQEPFNLNDHKPVVLVHCGHTLCDVCATKIMKDKKQCPFDNSRIETFIPNWSLQQILPNQPQPKKVISQSQPMIIQQEPVIKQEEKLTQTMLIQLNRALEQFDTLQFKIQATRDQNQETITKVTSLNSQNQQMIEQYTQNVLTGVQKFATQLQNQSNQIQQVLIQNRQNLDQTSNALQQIALLDRENTEQSKQFVINFNKFVNSGKLQQTELENFNQIQGFIENYMINFKKFSDILLRQNNIPPFSLQQKEKPFQQMFRKQQQVVISSVNAQGQEERKVEEQEIVDMHFVNKQNEFVKLELPTLKVQKDTTLFSDLGVDISKDTIFFYYQGLNQLIVSGGSYRKNHSQRFTVINLDQRQVQYKLQMIFKRKGHGAIEHNNKIYFISGHITKSDYQQKCECYDPFTQKFTEAGKMILAVKYFGTAFWDNQFWVFGGNTTGKQYFQKTIQYYLIDKDEWHIFPVLLYNSCICQAFVTTQGCVVFSDKLDKTYLFHHRIQNAFTDFSDPYKGNTSTQNLPLVENNGFIYLYDGAVLWGINTGYKDKVRKWIKMLEV